MFNPELFERVNYLSRRDNGDFSEEFSDDIAEMSGRGLDIGTGPGDLLVDVILPKLNPRATILCSDISERMVNFGKEKYKDNNRLSFAKVDIESPDLPKDLLGQFDHITSFYCIHWCKDMRQAFGNIFNLLRPGGTAFLTFLAKFPASDAYKYLAAMPRYQPYMKDADRYIPVFQHNERRRFVLKALLKDIGFEVRHCSVRERNYTFIDPNVLSDLMLAVNPFIGRIPADLAKAYEEDLVKEVVKQNLVVMNRKNDHDGDEYNVLFIYHVFVVSLKKPI